MKVEACVAEAGDRVPEFLKRSRTALERYRNFDALAKIETL
jgi:hypothetical protein